MRIIAGTLRGRRVDAPPGQRTRPMLDRVREGIFSTLQPWLEGAHVLDLFAGSGTLSFEALSRGATRARLVEQRPEAAVVAGRNAEALGLAARVQLLCGDALDPATWAPRPPSDLLVELSDDGPRSDRAQPRGDAASFGEPMLAGWDVVLFDPPYPMLRESARRAVLLEAIGTLVDSSLAREGVLVFHAPERALQAEELAAPDRSVARRTYGSNAIWYLQREAPVAPLEQRPDEPAEGAKG